MRVTPISMTVGPVTMGGKIFWMYRGGMNEINISTKAQQAAVPIMAPYPSGQGSCVPSGAVGQNPLAYICLKAPWATGIIAKDLYTD
jgi:hypothetical protein